MGEAWFMGDARRMFTELEGELSALGVDKLQAPLEEIASGVRSFGPRQEWHDWYHYLLSQTIPRAHEAFVSPLLEWLITGFMAIHPDGVPHPPYKAFLADVTCTLGRCLMERACWRGNHIVVGSFLHRSNHNPAGVWRWWDASGDFSSSMFFCLKYLPADCVRGWLQSVLAIPAPHWRAQVLVWFAGAHAMLTGATRWPSEFLLDARPAIDWAWSHCLGPPSTSHEQDRPTGRHFLPEASRSIALKCVRTHFTDDVFLDWLLSLSSVPYLVAEVADIPQVFEELYLR